MSSDLANPRADTIGPILRWQEECIRERISSLTSEIQRVRNKDHPYPQPILLYDTLRGILPYLLGFLTDAVETYRASPDGSRSLRAAFRAAEDGVREISRLFHFASHVDSTRIPFEILGAMSVSASHVIKRDCRIIMCLISDYNYELLHFDAPLQERNWYRWGWATAPRPALLLLGVPSSSVTSVLLHVLAAHELGHVLINDNLERLETTVARLATAVQKDWEEELNEHAINRALRHKGEGEKDAILRIRRTLEAEITQISSEWVKEVLADQVAARLVGPAFVAAFDRVALWIDRPTASHPAGSFRRALVADYLREVVKHVASDPIWAPYLAPGPGMEPEPDPISKLTRLISEEVCRRAAVALKEFASGVDSPLTRTDESSLKDQLKRIRRDFENLRPPEVPFALLRQKDMADAFWLLYYAAWHFRLDWEAFDTFARKYSWTPAEAEERIGNMLEHSIQYLPLRIRWARKAGGLE